MAPVNFAEQRSRDDGASSKSSRGSRSRSDDRYDDDYFEDDYDERHGRKKSRGRRRGRRGINPTLIVVIILVVAAIIAVLMIVNPFGSPNQSQQPQPSTSSVEVAPSEPAAQNTPPNTEIFDGVWRPTSFKTSAAEDIVSDEDIRIASVRGYGNGIVLKSDGTGQFLLMTDDSLDALYKEHKDATADNVEIYLAENSEFEWSKTNEKEASMTYDVSKLDVSKIKAGAKHAPFTTAKLQLRKQKLFMTFDDGSYISFDKEADTGTSLALMALTDEDKTQIDQMHTTYQSIIEDKLGGYTADELAVKMGVDPVVLADGHSVMFVDENNRWCAVYYCDAKGVMTGKTIWVDRNGAYEETPGAGGTTTTSSAAAASSDTIEKGTLTDDQFKKFKKAVDAVPTMTLAQVEEILGKANGTAESTDATLTGYTWNAEDASWQLRVWFDSSNIYQKFDEVKPDAEKKSDKAAEKSDAAASSEAAPSA